MISPLFTKNTDMDLASHGVWNFICSILTSTLLRVIALCKGDLYTLTTLAVTCTYCEKEMYLRCVELVEWFFF